MRVGVIGLGRMGARMAERARQAGHGLMVWNRSPEKTATFAERGVHVADSPAEIAARSDVVIVMVSDAAAVKEVLFREPDGLIRGLSTAPRPPVTAPDDPDVVFKPREGLVVVNTSTIAPHESLQVSEHLAAKGVRYVDAPVSGSVRAAEGGDLTFFVGGPEGLVTSLMPLFLSLGKEVVPVGPVGSGSAVKAVVNLQLAAQVGALAEGLAVAEREGLDPDVVLQAVLKSVVASPALRVKGEAMVAGRYVPAAFTTDLMVKDLAIAATSASLRDVDGPFARTARAVFEAAARAGYGEEDFAAVREVLAGSHAADRLEAGEGLTRRAT